MNFGQRFNEEFQKALEAKAFPAEKITSCTWWSHVGIALLFTSIIKLGINPADWRNLLEAIAHQKLTLYQFALLSNNLQERTPKELDMDIYGYSQIMEEADEYVKIWQEESKNLREEVTAKLQEEQAMKGTAERGVNILTPVKAEA